MTIEDYEYLVVVLATGCVVLTGIAYLWSEMATCAAHTAGLL